MQMQEARRVHGISSGSTAADPAVLERLQMEHARRVQEISSGTAAADLEGLEPRRRLVGVCGGHSFYADAW